MLPMKKKIHDSTHHLDAMTTTYKTIKPFNICPTYVRYVELNGASLSLIKIIWGSKMIFIENDSKYVFFFKSHFVLTKSRVFRTFSVAKQQKDFISESPGQVFFESGQRLKVNKMTELI